MFRWTRIAVYPLVACTALLFCGLAAAQDNHPSQKLLKKHLPYRQHQATGDKVIGVMVFDPQPVLSEEGRSGPPDQFCFSYNGLSYRWVYVPTQGEAIINNLHVPIGKDNTGGKMIFPKLNLANHKALQPFGVTLLHTLVEVEVNNGAGSPPNDSFVGTKFKVVEGTKEYPLKVGEVVDRLKLDYAKWVISQQAQIDQKMSLLKNPVKGPNQAGKPAATDLMYVTWMNQDKTLQVRFLSKVQDGNYTYTGGGVPPVPPFKLPPQPVPPAVQPGGAIKAPLLPPPPPPQFKFKVGTEFGVVYGRIYTVNKEGTITQTQNLELETFTHVIAPPPGVIGGPFGGVKKNEKD